MFRFYCQRVFNSFWFIGLLVFAAVLITSVTFSAPVERDLSVAEQRLLQPHFMAMSHTGQIPSRLMRQD